MISSSKYEFAKAKAGCEGCIFDNDADCPGFDKDNNKVLPPEQRICYNKENDTELIIVKEV